ncbi:MAG: NAD-dependent epimerase/dehydratase family protein [Cyanobacteria bacterium J06621_8]
MDSISHKVFITGGLGFIGGHLALQLLNNGCQVTVYDRCIHGEKPWHKKLWNHPHCRIVIGDLRNNNNKLKTALAGQDIVYHLAANANSRQSLRERNIDLHHGIEVTWNLLQTMAELKIPQIVYASSQLVYGEPNAPLLTESVTPLLPLSLYGSSKLSGEAIISAHSHLHGIRATILRFGNIVGSRMSYGIVCDFVSKLRHNPHTLEILGDGQQQRNYLHIEDCISAIASAASKNSKKPWEVYNVGNEDYISAETVANIVSSVILGHSNVDYQFTGGKRGWRGDVPNLRCDISKMRSLGWKPQRNSAEAVAAASKNFLDNEIEQDERTS